MTNLYHLDGCRIVAGDGRFLGSINFNVADPDSIRNVTGVYGSAEGALSIFNPRGDYGRPDGPLSAYNTDSADPPRIHAASGEFVAYLTKNEIYHPRVDPDLLKGG